MRRSGRFLIHLATYSSVCAALLEPWPPGQSRLAAAEPAVADGRSEWANWRGPQARAVATGARLPEPWPSGRLEPRWTVKLGTGWSSPVVSDGLVFVTDRDGSSERVWALEADAGRQRWRRDNPVDFDPHPVGRRHGNGPKSTPAAAAGRLFTLGIAGWLQCLRIADGEPVWQIDLPAQFATHQPLPGGRALVQGTESVIVPVGPGEGAPAPLFGYTGSPLVWRDLVVASVGGARGGTIMAFRQETGQVVWKSLSEHVSYSSPIAARLGGVDQVVVMTGPRVVGLEAASGKLLWSHPFQIQYDESISTPTVAGNLVLVTGVSRPLTALRITRSGEQWQADVAWTNELLSSYLSSMVAVGDYVYGMNDGGEFSCLRLADGRAQWTGGNHGYYCSPVAAVDRLLALNDHGALAVLAADPGGYRPLGLSRLVAAETWTMPAVVGNRLYVRSTSAVDCFELGR